MSQKADARSEKEAREGTPSRYERRKLETRAKLIRAAHSVMARKGVDAATVLEITTEADVGFGSFYNHFKSKDDIARAVFEVRTERLGIVSDQIERSFPNYAQAIAFVGRVYIEMAHADPVWSWFVIHAQNSVPLMDDILGKRAIRHFERGVKEDALHISDPYLAGMLTLSSFLSLMRAILEARVSKAAAIRALGMVLRMLGIPDDEIETALANDLPAPIKKILAEETENAELPA